VCDRGSQFTCSEFGLDHGVSHPVLSGLPPQYVAAD
jgi:hypothetical protein